MKGVRDFLGIFSPYFWRKVVSLGIALIERLDWCRSTDIPSL
jgi:hypothetical protein